MKKQTLLLTILGFCISFGTLLKAQQTEEQQKFKFSFSERIRLTTLGNAITLDKNTDTWTFSRWRTYIGVDYAPLENLHFSMQLGNESRVWFSPANKHTNFDEVFVNQLYVDWKNVGAIPLDLKIGRQNIMLDEGFVCFDGQPLTGSRSAYFNAVRGDFHIDANQTLTAFLSYNPKTDNLLPIINELKPSQLLEEQSNRGVGLYYQAEWEFLKKLSVYYFHKGTVANEKHSLALKRNTLGGRALVPFSSQWQCVAEGAYQFGKTGEETHSAYGGYLRFEYTLQNIPFAQRLSLGSFYLSGDDPETSKTEGWEPLWGRFPKWSESYIYTLIVENKGKVAYWSNMASLHAEIKGEISEKILFDAAYHHLWAVEDNKTEFCSGEGKQRGDLLICRIAYKIDTKWSGHLLWENFSPGNFYSSSADGYNWVRFELMYKF